MAEKDPRAKYRELPPTVDSEDLVTEIDPTLAEVEQVGKSDYEKGYDSASRWA